MKQIHIFDNHKIPKRFQNKKLCLIREYQITAGSETLIKLHIFAGKKVTVSTILGIQIANYGGMDFSVSLKKNQYIVVP